MRRTLHGFCVVLVLLGTAHARAQQEPSPDETAPPIEAEAAAAVEPAPGDAPLEPEPAPVVVAAAPATIGETWRGFRVLHVPLHEATTGTIDLDFTIEAPERAGTIVVHWRTPADGGVHDAEVRATPDGYQARLGAVSPPSFDYWVVRVTPAGEEPVFASEVAPQIVLVRDGERVEHEEHGLASVGGHRSAIDASFEWVDFGHRQIGVSTGLPDEYWHASAGYAYSFFDVVETIRFEFDSFRGAEGDLARARAGAMVGGHQVGLDYGRAEIVWYLLPLLRLRTAGIFGFSQRGFEGGAAGDLVIGDPRGVQVDLGATGITGLGLTIRARLGFLALPIVPLGASIEVTNFPAGEDFGVRLLLDAGIVLYPGALLRVRGGYQSRTAVSGGASLGGEVVFAF